MQYTDDKGNKLYGFSQESLEKTNREIKRTNQLLMLLILFVILFLVAVIFTIFYIDYNDVVTRLIYGG